MGFSRAGTSLRAHDVAQVSGRRAQNLAHDVDQFAPLAKRTSQPGNSAELALRRCGKKADVDCRRQWRTG
jgi:hypothetical protein